MARNKADNDFVMSHDLACIWRMEKGIAQSLENDNMNIGDQCEAWMREFATNSFELDKEEVRKFLLSMLNGDYEEVMTSVITSHILARTPDQDIAEQISRNITDFVAQHQHPREKVFRQFLVACVGISSLQLFVQNNWTGPLTSKPVMDRVSESLLFLQKDKHVQSLAKSTLCPEDCSIYPLVCLPELLLIARCILVESSNHVALCKTADWWRLRCLWVQQQVLDERSPQLYDLILPLINSIREDEILMSPEPDCSLPLMFHLECSHIFSYYYEYKKGTECIAKAKKLAGIEVGHTGALGKRTKFQIDDKAQLVLTVTRNDEGDRGSEPTSLSSSTEGLPKDLQLDDDTVLHAINFTEDMEGKIPLLTRLEQAIVLGECMEHKRSKPKDLLVTEELKTYVVGLLRQPQSWMIHTLALRLRCLLEKDKRRTVERAMMQMQVLVDQIPSTECPGRDRLKLFYAVSLPPKWTLEGELAGLLTSLGCTSAALEIYVRLELWEDVIRCYKSIGKPEKAIHIIEEELAKEETALMWCLFGDVTLEKKYYEKAWEVSGQKSSRAMKSLGLIYLHDEEFLKAIECLELSLDRNYLQYGAWFSLGFCSFQSKKYETAVKAYRRCVQLENDDSQSWNNLATAFIKLKDKPKAFRTLREAIKCNYENWKIWDNFLGVCIDIGEFGESIRAYGRLLDLKKKHVDEAVLEVMVRAVLEDLMDCHEKPVSLLKPKILELFGRITSEVTANATVWSLYAKLLGSCQSDNLVQNDKALQCLQRAHRLVTQDEHWQTEVSQVKEVIDQTLTLAEAYEYCSKEKTNDAQTVQLLSSAKLMIKSVISKIKKEHYDAIVPPPTWAEVSQPVEGLETKLQELLDSISQLKSG
ncbi:tetratricopeptide repeat protein 27 [Strongylocentrotus purpuratus]|uniref:Tetratricopeptide repeat protein 27 n=1 Tax=Strongylocentrotus purpuratus TaxID=7668 RepID=A0A7M7PSC5_STRPU|nr:tetratricopeptide repeat protein 27 [Strongylocentrotus purpuratus]